MAVDTLNTRYGEIKMYVMIFDTETTSLEKPYTYNIGYVIYDTLENKIILKREYIVEQIWYNAELFNTAYYANKRPLYVSAMKGKRAKLRKFGHICQRMIYDIKHYNVQYAYAYNSPFDEKVFNYNCEWYHCINPFDTIDIIDIRGLVFKSIAFTSEYKDFSDTYKLYSESGNYSTNAQNIYRFVSENAEFIEEHTALSDSIIECEILNYCIILGCEYGKHYKVYSNVPRTVSKTLTIKDTLNNEVHIYKYFTMRRSDKGSTLTLK